MTVQDEKVRMRAEKHIFRYVTQGDYVRDQIRFGNMIAFIKDKFPGIQRVVGVGCGSAEESMAIATAGIKYEGYDISPAYLYRFPLDITEEINTQGSELGQWFRSEYERYDDIGEELDTLAHPGKVKDSIQINIGKDYDATKPEFWEAIEKGSRGQDYLILFRHPDVKDDFDISSSMIRSSIEMRSPVVITTSNTMSLALLLSIIDEYVVSQAESSSTESLDNKTLEALLSANGDFREKIGEVTEEVLDKLPVKGLTALTRPMPYISIFEGRGNKSYKLKDGSVVRVEIEHTPDFSRDEPHRKLDSWMITIERIEG